MQKEIMKRETAYFKPNTRISNFIPVPRSILREDLTASAKLVYGLLVARTMLSQKAENRQEWTDEAGRIYIRYTIQNLSRDSHLGKSTVSSALSELKQKGLIRTKRNGSNQANRIYVKYITDSTQETEQNLELQTPKKQNSEYQNLDPIYTESKQKKDIFPDSYRKIHNFEERHRSPEEWNKLEEMLFNV